MDDHVLFGDRYRPLRHVGAGGAGDVYLVEDTRLGVERALKLLFEPSSGSSTVRERFLSEARLLARLQHPHLVPVYDVGTHGPRVFFVMEYAPHGTLRDRMLKPIPIAAKDAAATIAQVADALEFVHARGVIHRDVKPENILQFERRRWRIGDFGVARFHDEHRDDLTRTGDYLGTLGYMAPEQRMDPRWARPPSDVYAMGATLFTLLSGTARPPPDLYAHELTEREHPEIHPLFLEVVRRSTRMRPRDRFPTAGAMRDALEWAVATVTG